MPHLELNYLFHTQLHVGFLQTLYRRVDGSMPAFCILYSYRSKSRHLLQNFLLPSVVAHLSRARRILFGNAAIERTSELY